MTACTSEVQLQSLADFDGLTYPSVRYTVYGVSGSMIVGSSPYPDLPKAPTQIFQKLLVEVNCSKYVRIEVMIEGTNLS